MAMLTEVQYHRLFVGSHPNGVEEKSLTFIATLNQKYFLEGLNF